MCDGRHKAIWDEMLTDIKARNRVTKMVQARLGRIERKLFTSEENRAFFMELVVSMLKEDW